MLKVPKNRKSEMENKGTLDKGAPWKLPFRIPPIQGVVPNIGIAINGEIQTHPSRPTAS